MVGQFVYSVNLFAWGFLHTYDLGKWFTENHNLNGVSAKLHITLIFLRESLGRTCIWFEEDPSRAVPSRSLYYVGRCFATSCQCYFASVTSLRASRRINSIYLITCSFFKLLRCFNLGSAINLFRVAGFSIPRTMRSLERLSLSSPMQLYMSSPKSVARSNRYQMTHLVVGHVYWTHTVRTFRSSPHHSILLAAAVLHRYLLPLLQSQTSNTSGSIHVSNAATRSCLLCVFSLKAVS